jgi:WD40 repeat protein
LIWNAADPGTPKPEQKSFFGVDEVYALEMPLRVLEVPVRGPRSPEGGVELVGFSPDGTLLLTTHRNGDVKIWSTGSWTQQGELAVAESRLSAMALAPDSKTVMAADEKGVLHQWDLRKKTQIRTVPTSGNVVGLEFSRDGKMLISTQMGKKTLYDSTVMIWNTADWSQHTEEGYSCIAISHSGKLLALGARGYVKVIEPSSHKEIRTLTLPEMPKGQSLGNPKAPNANEKFPYLVSALAFSPDDDTLAVAGADGTIILIHPNSYT